jgi:hypothetical protein
MLMILSRGGAPSSLAPGYHIARRWRAEPVQAIGAKANDAPSVRRTNGAPLTRGADAGYWRADE